MGLFSQEFTFYGYCLNVSPNSYEAHGVYANATRFGRFGRVFEVYGYTIFTLVGKLKPTTNIDNVLATTNAWPPPLPPSTSYGGPRLDDLGDTHARSYG